MAYTFDDAGPKGRHTTQYFEIFGNRAIYHDGWLAGTVHQRALGGQAAPHARRTTTGSSTTREDFSLANDLAAKNPAKAEGDAGSLPGGGGEVPRPSDRRPEH